MARRGGSVVAALAIAAGLAVGSAPPAIAAPPDNVVALPGATAGAVVVDWDAPTIARVVAPPSGAGAVLAEAWTAESGPWRALGEPRELRRQAAASELSGFTARLADAESRVPVTRADHVRLLAVTLDGERRAMAVASVFISPTCCTSLIAIDPGGGGVRLEHLAERLPPVDTALALDLDGDGSDELLVRTVPMSAASTPARLVAYGGQAGGAFVELARTELPEGMSQPPFVLGESDGRAGAEVGLLDHAGLGRLGRVSLGPDRSLRVELAGLLAPRDPRQDVTGVAALPDASVFVATGSSSYRAAWPAGGEPDVVAGGNAGGAILGVLGTDAGPRIITRHPITTGLEAMDVQLRGVELAIPESRVGPSLWLPEYTGPVPAEGGLAAVVAGGAWIEPAADTLPASAVLRFAGTHPLAVVGPAREWLVLLRSVDPRAMSAAGGPLRHRADWLDDRLSIVPTEAARRAQDEASGVDWLALDDAAILERSPRDPADLAIAAASTGFSVRVSAEPESIVHVHLERELTTHHVGNGDLRVELPAASSGPILLALVEPSGRSRSVRLVVDTVIAGPPPLEVAASTELFSPRVLLDGRTSPHARVTVDGGRVAVAQDGRFRAELEAGPVPRSLAVHAVDPLGTSTSVDLAVVGWLDYLGAPWPAFLAVVALALGAVLAWRRPPAARRPSAVDLEELDASG